jgi:hypothetical protein
MDAKPIKQKQISFGLLENMTPEDAPLPAQWI